MQFNFTFPDESPLFQVLIGILTIGSDHYPHNIRKAVSSPYRYSNNNFISMRPGKNLYVSSPYRYSNNWRTGKKRGVSNSFQVLIGILTIAHGSGLDIFKLRFQVLIGILTIWIDTNYTMSRRWVSSPYRYSNNPDMIICGYMEIPSFKSL